MKDNTDGSSNYWKRIWRGNHIVRGIETPPGIDIGKYLLPGFDLVSLLQNSGSADCIAWGVTPHFT